MADKLIEIVEDGEIISWQATDPDSKQVYDSRFELRVMPKSVERTLRKKYTKFEFTRQGRQENFESGPFVDDVLDYTIVGWSGVRRQGQELPCERQWKVKLPEVWKGEIVRLCLGRELGEVLLGMAAHETAEGEGGDAEDQTANPNPTSNRVTDFVRS